MGWLWGRVFGVAHLRELQGRAKRRGDQADGGGIEEKTAAATGTAWLYLVAYNYLSALKVEEERARQG